MIRLADCISVQRRYMRSVNLERDLDDPGSLDGYTLTPRAIAALDRIARAEASPKTACAWTITGVYGSGKSAFAHYVAALHDNSRSVLRQRALAELRNNAAGKSLAMHFRKYVPASGFVRAVTSAKREPVAQTVTRALARAADAYWSLRRGRRPKVLNHLQSLEEKFRRGGRAESAALPSMVQDVAQASGSGVLLIIDELGKVLENAGTTGQGSDLYLLQQLAELSGSGHDCPVVVVGLLHQAFSEYGTALGITERAEWEKVQGRFEDLAFTGAAEEMLVLLGQAIRRRTPAEFNRAVAANSHAWAAYLHRALPQSYVARALVPELINSIYPLHPVTGLVLPYLCARYAQNDRSLFTFLASNEDHSFARFLTETSVSERNQPLLRLPEIYDYFVSIISAGLSVRPQFQRWTEVHAVVRDARDLSPDEEMVLKTIATLNLLSTSGPLRASRNLVLAAVRESPKDSEDRWKTALEGVMQRRLATFRNQVDEFRIWEGSDFDVEAETRVRVGAERRSLAQLLNEITSLSPFVAQRHSYQTGTLRYFERQFIDSDEQLAQLRCRRPETDGVIAYWVGDAKPLRSLDATPEGKPVLLAILHEPKELRAVALEFAALRDMERGALELQSDGVARREVRARLQLAQIGFERTLRDGLAPLRLAQLTVRGRKVNPASLHASLSLACDELYLHTPIVRNELINRRELTSQGARARRELIEAILLNSGEKRLGIVGEGPAYSMYASLLLATGIHRRSGDSWEFGPPTEPSVKQFWNAIEQFCLEAQVAPCSFDNLYRQLERPPYGAKAGIIPVFIAAALVAHEEDLTVYHDGTFLPTLGPEHFELLVRQPSQFAVKHFALTGLRREFFRDLQSMISSGEARQHGRNRNATLLRVVRPLVRFATSLPKVTQRTEQVSQVARDVRGALLTATDPDTLVFDALPRACGHAPFGLSERVDRRDYPAFRQKLKDALRELNQHYDSLLSRCRSLLHNAFGVRSDLARLREDLGVRAQYLVGQVLEPRLRAFVAAAARSESEERDWLESLVMIVADRPLETWADDDALAFEVNLTALARRFANLEALQKEAVRNHRPGHEARRLVITRPDGGELTGIVWVDAEEVELLEEQAELLLERLNVLGVEHQRQAVAIRLLERLLAPADVLDHSHEPVVSHG